MREVPLTQGRFALVDDEDFAAVSARRWCVDANGYVNSRRGRLHRFLMPGVARVDHVNGNKFDNCRSNLRQASHAENVRNRGINRNNTSGFKGVSWDKVTRRWDARIMVDRRIHFLGRHDTAEAAAYAYDAAATRLHGAFARINFP